MKIKNGVTFEDKMNLLDRLIELRKAGFNVKDELDELVGNMLKDCRTVLQADVRDVLHCHTPWL